MYINLHPIVSLLSKEKFLHLIIQKFRHIKSCMEKSHKYTCFTVNLVKIYSYNYGLDKVSADFRSIPKLLNYENWP